MTPGTNLIAISARDVNGNYSANYAVRLVYVVSAPLAASINGGGAIAPNYNNARLQLGVNYAMTAVPKTGFTFTNWTDGNGNIVTNKPGLKFNMASDLSFTANFLDFSKPALVIRSPTTLSSAANQFYVASGRAIDNAAVAKVLYQINGGDWYPASTTNQWTNWTVTLGVVPGTNLFSAYAVDTSGNLSATNPVKFIYATAPDTLNGLRARVTPDDGPAFGVAFGANTFSQDSSDAGGINGVGSYAYTRLTPTSGRLKVTYAAPPLAKNEAAQQLGLDFSAPGLARFTDNTLAGMGSMVFTSTPTLLPPTFVNQTVVYVNSQGEGSSTRFSAGQSVAASLPARTIISTKNYSYTSYSPVGALIRQAGANSMAYTVVTFHGTNYGAAYSEEYDAAGHFSGTNQGVFGLASRRPAGNAPASLASRSALVTSSGEHFKLLFNTSTFAQLSLADDLVTNSVGSYVYARVGTNAGNLDFNFTAPLQFSSSLFQFVAPNFAVFTNADGTMGAAVFK